MDCGFSNFASSCIHDKKILHLKGTWLYEREAFGRTLQVARCKSKPINLNLSSTHGDDSDEQKSLNICALALELEIRKKEACQLAHKIGFVIVRCITWHQMVRQVTMCTGEGAGAHGDFQMTRNHTDAVTAAIRATCGSNRHIGQDLAHPAFPCLFILDESGA